MNRAREPACRAGGRGFESRRSRSRTPRVGGAVGLKAPPPGPITTCDPDVSAIVVTNTPAEEEFPGSAAYWERRYQRGGNSGAGSRGEEAEYKAAYVNRLVAEQRIRSVVELGQGDGNQLTLARYPRYLGLDVSPTAVATCVERFAHDPTKSFVLCTQGLFADPAGFLTAELAISLDVVYHLIEDEVFDRYLRDLFSLATRFVAIYGWDAEVPDGAAHVLHRPLSPWIEANTNWSLFDRVESPGPPFKQFLVYAR